MSSWREETDERETRVSVGGVPASPNALLISGKVWGSKRVGLQTPRTPDLGGVYAMHLQTYLNAFQYESHNACDSASPCRFNIPSSLDSIDLVLDGMKQAYCLVCLSVTRLNTSIDAK